MKRTAPATAVCIEPLEARIAPAAAFGTYTDIDGDPVKVSASTPGVLTLSFAGKLTFNGAGTGEQLTLLDLRDASFQGTTITPAVERAAGGGGFMHIGRLDATGRDLAAAKIKGDLAVIEVGDADTSAASPALTLLDRPLRAEHSGRLGRSGQRLHRHARRAEGGGPITSASSSNTPGGGNNLAACSSAPPPICAHVRS